MVRINNLILGDCLDKIKQIESNSIDSIVTDPPYGLSAAKNSGKTSKVGFMGKKWDCDIPSQDIWKECLRVLKPGGHLLSFAAARTYHRMAVTIEDAGFEIRDQIMWIYGSGFPKSHNIAKSIDKLQGNYRKNLGANFNYRQNNGENIFTNNGTFETTEGMKTLTKGNSPYEGWGSALKPAHEPIVMARKPLSEKTIASNVLKWGCGGINIDATRVEATDGQNRSRDKSKSNSETFFKGKKGINQVIPEGLGRFPANIIHDGSDEVLQAFPQDKKSLARFFYCAKASRNERNEGLENYEGEKVCATSFSMNEVSWCKNCNSSVRDAARDERPNSSCFCDLTGERDFYYRKKKILAIPTKNIHPTVKPVKLMQYLIKLATPKDGICLDPFMGSGSTGKAAKLEGFSFIGIEREEEYFSIAKARIEGWEAQARLL